MEKGACFLRGSTATLARLRGHPLWLSDSGQVGKRLLSAFALFIQRSPHFPLNPLLIIVQILARAKMRDAVRPLCPSCSVRSCTRSHAYHCASLHCSQAWTELGIAALRSYNQEQLTRASLFRCTGDGGRCVESGWVRLRGHPTPTGPFPAAGPGQQLSARTRSVPRPEWPLQQPSRSPHGPSQLFNLQGLGTWSSCSCSPCSFVVLGEGYRRCNSVFWWCVPVL